MNNIPSVFWLVPVASVVSLGMALFFYLQMKKADEGTPRMKEIAEYVRHGAMAYLKQQYKVVTIVFIVLAVIFSIMAYGFQLQNPWVPFAFLTGGFFSGLAGFFGILLYAIDGLFFFVIENSIAFRLISLEGTE